MASIVFSYCLSRPIFDMYSYKLIESMPLSVKYIPKFLSYAQLPDLSVGGIIKCAKISLIILLFVINELCCAKLKLSLIIDS